VNNAIAISHSAPPEYYLHPVTLTFSFTTTTTDDDVDKGYSSEKYREWLIVQDDDVDERAHPK
jgi:hypothetical protein